MQLILLNINHLFIDYLPSGSNQQYHHFLNLSWPVTSQRERRKVNRVFDTLAICVGVK